MQDRMWLAPQSQRRRAPDFAERKGFDGNIDCVQHLIQIHEFHMSFDREPLNGMRPGDTPFRR